MPTPADTAAAVEQAKANLANALAAHDEATANAEPARKPEDIVLAFMEAVAGRFGHHPDLDALVREFKAAVEPPPPAPEEAEG